MMYWKGKRVQIPAYTDRWMMGDRFGSVIDERVFVDVRYLMVKLDISGRTFRFIADDCREV